MSAGHLSREEVVAFLGGLEGGLQWTASADPGSSFEPLSQVAVPTFVITRPGAGTLRSACPSATQGSNVFTTVAWVAGGVVGVALGDGLGVP